LDTGPTDDEIDRIRTIFSALDMDAGIEGHSYGGPPPQSAFLIVVYAPLVPLLDTFVGHGTDGHIRFRQWAEQIQSLRSDERRWARRHALRLEDAHTEVSVPLAFELPDRAYRALLDTDLSGFDRGSPPTTIEWNEYLLRWRARPCTTSHPIVRRLPARRYAAGETLAVRELTDAELRDLRQLTAGLAVPAITRQRAEIVLWSGLGWSAKTIASRLLISEDRVRAIARNFNAHGFASLNPGYLLGGPIRLRPEEECEAREIARAGPREYGLSRTNWNAGSLGEFLVSEGVIEDATIAHLEDLLDDTRSTG
jgi:transposase